MKKNIDKLSLGVSILPLTLFIIRRLKIGMIAPWTYIIFAVYALIIVAGFVFAVYLMKNKNTRTPTANDTPHPAPYILHQLSQCGHEPESVTVYHGTFQHYHDAELLRTRNIRFRKG